MESRLEKTNRKIDEALPALMRKARITKGEVLGILQGIVGFVGAAASGNFFGAAGAVLGVGATLARRYD
jgi:hypothetical protein